MNRREGMSSWGWFLGKFKWHRIVVIKGLRSRSQFFHERTLPCVKLVPEAYDSFILPAIWIEPHLINQILSIVWFAGYFSCRFGVEAIETALDERIERIRYFI